MLQNSVPFDFSDLYPIKDHFLCLTARDRSKTWQPVSTIIMDIPTAYALFGSNPERTLHRVQGIVKKMVDDWNAEQATKASVSN